MQAYLTEERIATRREAITPPEGRPKTPESGRRERHYVETR